MRSRVGTSGYAYKEWKGPFYPEDLKDADMLAYYAERLDTVEINNTFYRLPNRKTIEGWASRTPETFSMVLKASRKISHKKGLEDVADALTYLVETAGGLGPRLGPMLFQFPPWLRKNLERLEGLTSALPAGFRAALEFRHASWFDDETYEFLRARGLALVVSDTDPDEDDEPGELPPVTAPYGYFRLRRASYDDDALRAWGARIGGLGLTEAHVFFKHEDEGAAPKMAARFRELAAP